MKLDYKILWIDNDLQDYIDNETVNDVEDFLLGYGFEPVIEKVFDEANLDLFLDKHSYDLIISDYNLENITGDIIIERIRNEKQLDTEILFYTAQIENSYKNNQEVRDRLAFTERLTFQIGRDTLVDKIEKVIKLTLHKLLELNATRGLITSATSELDVEIEEIFELLINLIQENGSTAKIERIFKTDYKEIKKNLLKKCRNQRDAHTTDFKLYFSQSDAFRKWDILKEIIAISVPKGFDLKLFKNYYDQVIVVRNKFAHSKEIINKEGLHTLKGNFGNVDFEYTEANCIEIRKNLINHKRNIDILKKTIRNI